MASDSSYIGFGSMISGLFSFAGLWVAEYRMVPFLTEMQAAAVCGVSIQTFRRWSAVPGFPRRHANGKYLQTRVRAWCIARGGDPVWVVRRLKSRKDRLLKGGL